MEFIDVTHTPALAQWHAVHDAAWRREALSLSWTLPELVAGAAIAWPRRTLAHIAGVVDGETVVAGSIGLPQLDHLSHAYLEVFTRPDVRRRGYAAAMLAHLEGLGRAQGRSVFGVEVVYPLDYPADGEGHPGAAFARSRGYEFGLAEMGSALRLPVDTTVLDELARDAEPWHRGYELRTFHGPGPAEIDHQVSVLDSTLPTEAPSGSLTLENQTVDEECDRIGEVLLAAQRRTRVRTVALLGDEVVAYSDLLHPGYEPGRAYQWGTLVRRDHRGHRLGLAVKAANLRQFQRQFPEPAEVITFNAEDNTHMRAVNTAMGFVPVVRMGEFEKRLASGE